MLNVWGVDVSAVPPTIPADAPTGYPTDGSSTGSTKATTPKAFWYYMIAEEIINAIKGGGLTPERNTLDQLNQSIDARIQKISDKIDEVVDDVAGSIAKVESIPTGAMIYTPLDKQPSEYWIKCDGRAVSRSAYPALFAYLGTQFGSGDGSTTFNMPDYRGCFLRVLDNGRGYDSGRKIATYQGDAMRNLTGNHAVDSNAYTATGVFEMNRGSVGRESASGTGAARSVYFDASRQVPTANEFRPKNYSVCAWMHI